MEAKKTAEVKRVINDSEVLDGLTKGLPIYKIKLDVIKARLLFLDGKFNEAISALKKTIDGIDEKHLPHLQVEEKDFGKVFIKKNTYQRTVVYLPLYLNLAEAEFEIGNYKESLHHLEIAAIYDSSISYIYYLKTLNLIKLRSYNKAKESMEKVVDSNKGLEFNLLIQKVSSYLDAECKKGDVECQELRNYLTQQVSAKQ